MNNTFGDICAKAIGAAIFGGLAALGGASEQTIDRIVGSFFDENIDDVEQEIAMTSNFC